MPELNWLVERSVSFTDVDTRQQYIEMLEEVIQSLKEKNSYGLPTENEGEKIIDHIYSLPTVIFACAAHNTKLNNLDMQLLCFADMQEFYRYVEFLDQVKVEMDEKQ